MRLSIIIPTLNEASYLDHTLSTIYQRCRAEPEVIVVDSGSTDQTVALARRYPATVVADASLRGSKWRSLNKGAALARGDTYLFLDADSIVPSGFDTASCKPWVDSVSFLVR